ncbi:MAG TPA: hypothetical protein VIQ03_16320 [Gammaproteobacteria bacterium]
MSQKSSMAPMLFKTHLDFQRKIIRDRLEEQEAQKKQIEKITARERLEHQNILHLILNKNPGLSKSNTHLLVIPTGLSKLISLSKDRIKNYTEHLNSIINQAMEYTDASEVVYDQHHHAHERLAEVNRQFNQNPKLQNISDKLCCLCKGGCCASGKDHAYLSVITIRRYMDNHPDVSKQDILDLYLSNISLETIEGACINQTSTGCALPRELRSDICNGYYCDTLKTYQKKLKGKENIGVVLAIQRSKNNFNWFDPNIDNEIVNIALLDEDKLHLVDVSFDD